MHLVEIEKKGSDWLTCSFCLLLGRSLNKGKLGLDTIVLKHPKKDNSFVLVRMYNCGIILVVLYHH